MDVRNFQTKVHSQLESLVTDDLLGKELTPVSSDTQTIRRNFPEKITSENVVVTSPSAKQYGKAWFHDEMTSLLIIVGVGLVEGFSASPFFKFLAIAAMLYPSVLYKVSSSCQPAAETKRECLIELMRARDNLEQA